MKTLYVLHKDIGFFNSMKKPYYLVMRTDGVRAVDNITGIERDISTKISVGSAQFRVQQKIWIAFPSRPKMKAYILQLELDKTIGE